MMFASTLGVFVAITLFGIASIFALVGIISSVGSTPAYTPKANTVFKIKLNGPLVDNTKENPLDMLMGNEESTLSLKDLLSAIRTARQNDNIRGIYLESGALSTGSASLTAIRDALAEFKKSGKFVVAYADNYTQGNYYLCSVADQLFLNPLGILQLTGLASQTMFYKGLLDKLGVEMQVFKVGIYKGAVEPFMLDKLSEANREQIQSYINSIWDKLVQDIAEGRKISADTINDFANQGLAFTEPKTAVEYGLVDDLKYKPEVEEYIKELAGQSGKKLETADIEKIKSIPSIEIEKENRIAVLYAEGEIKPYAPSTPYETEAYISEKVADELIKLKDDDKVKAVVFRVNSPGGSAFVSEQIWRQVVELKQVKPIVVSMGDVAASGGYYISCAANKIVAEPNTLTGSIGIFGLFPNVNGLFNKLAVTSDIVKTHTFADMGDITRPMSSDEKILLQNYINKGYETFITRCADGRNMSKEAINQIGQGRVWTGKQALENGLVDQLGGIDTAIEAAAELAGITDYSIKEVSGTKDFLTNFIEKQLGNVRTSVVKSVLGEDYAYFNTLRKLRSTGGIQARLPYDMKPL